MRVTGCWFLEKRSFIRVPFLPRSGNLTLAMMSSPSCWEIPAMSSSLRSGATHRHADENIGGEETPTPVATRGFDRT